MIKKVRILLHFSFRSNNCQPDPNCGVMGEGKTITESEAETCSPEQSDKDAADRNAISPEELVQKIEIQLVGSPQYQIQRCKCEQSTTDYPQRYAQSYRRQSPSYPCPR